MGWCSVIRSVLLRNVLLDGHSEDISQLTHFGLQQALSRCR